MQAIQRDRVVALTNFVVMVDECNDVNGVQKGSICIRLFSPERLNSQVHCNKFGLSPGRLHVASFDGASNMRDHRDHHTNCIYGGKFTPGSWLAPHNYKILYNFLP